MSRRILVLVTLVTALLAGSAGCGIPGQTDVRIDGHGPLPGNNQEEGGGPAPPRREAATDVEEFVDNFLASPAGEMATAYDRVNEYIAPGGQLRPGGDETAINVVRLTGRTTSQQQKNLTDVTISVQHIGVLRADGTLGEPVAGERSYTFTVGRVQGNDSGTNGGTSRGFYVLKAPPLLLLTVTALGEYYQPRTIYFWNAGRTALVPDLRYLPDAVPSPREATEVLGWLILGPARWLATTATRLPEGTRAIGNVPDPQPNRRLEVNLSMPAEAVDDEAKLGQLITQLAWSLPDRTSSPLDRPSDLELKIQGKSRKVVNIENYLRSHPPYRVVGDPVPFGIQDRQIHSLHPGRAEVPMNGEFNREVVSAALNRDGTRAWAALVTGDREGPHRLRTGAGPERVREMGISKPYDSMGQPVWLKSSDPAHPAGLIVVNGDLMRFDVDANLTGVSVPGIPDDKRLTAVAAALDGHRIALVVQGGGLYVAAVGVEPDSVSVGPAHLVRTSQTDLTAVSWIGEDWLVVAGRQAGRIKIFRISIDGARESEEVSQVPEPVTQLAAYPDNPVVKVRTGNLLYSAGTGIYSDVEPVSPDPAVSTPESPLTSPFFYY